MPIIKYDKYLPTGATFGRLTVIGVDESSKYDMNGKLKIPSRWKYLCECSCSAKNRVAVRKDALVGGVTRSCGCYNREIVSTLNSKVNRIEECGEYIKIFFFNCNGYTIVDKEDYKKVKSYCWFRIKSKNKKVFYAMARDNKTSVTIHRLICGNSNSLVIDHKNGNGLDNRKENLRICTSKVNAENKHGAHRNSSSGVYGISKKSGKWEVNGFKNGKYVYIGSFKNFNVALKKRLLFEKENYPNKIRDNTKRIIVISGFCASGKDTILNMLLDNGYNSIVSTTSRPMRNGEVNGKEYNFIEKEEFLKRISTSKFLEYRKYNTLLNGNPEEWYYGVEYDKIPDGISVVVLDVSGIRAFKQKFGENLLCLFLKASKDERINRCKLRGDFDPIEFNRRYEDDCSKFTDKVLDREMHYVIASDNKDGTFDNALKIIQEWGHITGTT